MSIILVIAALVLVVVLFSLVYRILSLVDVAKKDKSKRVGTSNTVNAILFPLFFIVGFALVYWSYDYASARFLPVSASEHGERTDMLFWVTTGITFVVFVLTHVVLFFAPFVFRFREGKRAHWYPHNNKLEVLWTVVPAIVLTILVLYGYVVWTDITQKAPDGSAEIEIMGKQFNWMVRYPGKDGALGKFDYRKIDATNAMGLDFTDSKNNDDFIPREIHFPKGKNVLLKIRARDVIHSVFLPHFRVKMDAVPGMPTSFWFTPKYTTAEMREITKNPDFNYELACTEVCGSGHFAMKMIVVVDEPADYEKWVAEQEPWAKSNADYIKSLSAKSTEELTVAAK